MQLPATTSSATRSTVLACTTQGVPLAGRKRSCINPEATLGNRGAHRIICPYNQTTSNDTLIRARFNPHSHNDMAIDIPPPDI